MGACNHKKKQSKVKGEGKGKEEERRERQRERERGSNETALNLLITHEAKQVVVSVLQII
jgi:hypothetical protein